MEIQIISLLIALLAVIVGPLITYRITKKNLEFQFRTLIQEKWVTNLEEAALTFLNTSSEWINKYPLLHDDGYQLEYPDKEIDRMLDTINSSIFRLEFLLDENKMDQALVLTNVASMASIIHTRVYDDVSISILRKNHEEIISTLQEIFRKERTKMTNIFR